MVACHCFAEGACPTPGTHEWPTGLQDPLLTLLVFNAQRPPIESRMTLVTQKLHAQVDCPRWSHPLLEPFGMLGHHFWRLQGGMPSSIMLCQQRDVGSSLLPNSCANTAELKWNVSEYSTTVTAGALEQAVQARRPGGRYYKNLHSRTPQDLDRKPRALIMHAH